MATPKAFEHLARTVVKRRRLGFIVTLGAFLSPPLFAILSSRQAREVLGSPTLGPALALAVGFWAIGILLVVAMFRPPTSRAILPLPRVSGADRWWCALGLDLFVFLHFPESAPGVGRSVHPPGTDCSARYRTKAANRWLVAFALVAIGDFLSEFAQLSPGWRTRLRTGGIAAVVQRVP